MSTMKVHVVKGVNSYTGDLLKKQNRNINRRREVNFNVDSLNEHERSSSRSKSFAIYKPPTKFKSESTAQSKAKTKTKVEFDPGLRTRDNVNEVFATKFEPSDEDELAERHEKFEDEVEAEKRSDRARDEDSEGDADLAVPGYGFADQDAFDREADNDDADGPDDNDRAREEEVEDILGGDVPAQEDKVEKAESITFEDVFNSDDREKSIENYDRDDDQEAWGYNFSSNRDGEDDASVTTTSDKGSANVFQKFRDKIKETYDRSGFKEMHKKNMEVLRKQFKSVLGGKKGRSGSQSSEETGSGSSEYWESKADATLDKADFAPKPYGFGANRFHPKVLNYESDDDAKKRCCCC